MTIENIRHQGVIERIEKHKVFIKIIQKAACSDCHAKSACMSSDKKEKIIEVYDDSGKFSIHEDVIVSTQSSMGHLAVIIAFIIPLILVVAAIFVGIKISGKEGISGLIGLSILVPYYYMLYIFRDKLKKNFVFTLSKMDYDITCN
jgi:Positive regulator of sigma E activity